MSSITQYLGAATLVVFIFLAGQVQAAQQDIAAGEKLYKTICITCHKEKPALLMGKPVAELAGKLQRYKDMTNATGRAMQMQQVAASLSPQQIQDVSAYLNGLQ